MAKMLRDVYAQDKDGKTVLLKSGTECPKDMEKLMSEKGYSETASKPQPKK